MDRRKDMGSRTAGAPAGAGPESGERLDSLLKQAAERTQAKEWAEAAPLWKRVVALNPTDGGNWSNLGWTSYQIKDYRTAIKAYAQAMELRAGYPFTSAYNIACCYALLGDREQALSWLDRSFAMGWRDVKQAQEDDDLKSLHDNPHFRDLVALVDTSRMTRDEGWRYDLSLLAREIKRLHYAPFRKVSQARFDAAVQKLNDGIPTLTDHQIEVGMMRLMAMM
jgi:tetratricopeptide (TPR) repeat protein